jgi:hypothetical protein
MDSPEYVSAAGQRSAKVIAKALSAGFHRIVHRALPRPVGSTDAWHDHCRGQVTFAVYVQSVWLPSKVGRGLHAGRVPVLPRQALPAHLRRDRDGEAPSLARLAVLQQDDTSVGGPWHHPVGGGPQGLQLQLDVRLWVR